MKARNAIVVLVGLVAVAIVVLVVSRTPSQPVVIDIVGEALPPLEALGRLAEEYTAETGVEIRIHPFEFETALQRAQLDFTSGAGDYDLVMAIFYNQGRYFEAGNIIPFDDSRFDGQVPEPVSGDSFYPAVRAATMDYGGSLVAYPFSAQTMFLWYRKDLFEHPGERSAFLERYGYDLPVPDPQTSLTWGEYRDLAEFFTRGAGEDLAGATLAAARYGTALQMKRHPASFYEFTNFVYSIGDGFFNESGRPTVDTPGNRRALDYYLSLREFAPPGYLQATWDDALAQMQQGTVAMTIMWSDAPSELYKAESSSVVDKVGYALVPVDATKRRQVSVFGGWGFMINADSDIPEECYKFVQWVSRPRQQLAWAKDGGLPAAASIFDDPEYIQIPYMPAQNEALKHLVTWPRDPKAEQFVNLGIEYLSLAASDQLTAAEALTELQRKASALYDEE